MTRSWAMLIKTRTQGRVIGQVEMNLEQSCLDSFCAHGPVVRGANEGRVVRGPSLQHQLAAVVRPSLHRYFTRGEELGRLVPAKCCAELRQTPDLILIDQTAVYAA